MNPLAAAVMAAKNNEEQKQKEGDVEDANNANAPPPALKSSDITDTKGYSQMCKGSSLVVDTLKEQQRGETLPLQ